MNTLAEPQMNATPLIDVLLVLLVMLVLTLPMATHAVKLNLPQPASGPPSSVVTLHIDFDGQLYWNGANLPHAGLDSKLREVSAAMQPPRLKVVPDKRVRYEDVAQVLAAARRLSVSRLEVAPIF